ncbi:hypothetical protein CONPUDRAFT_145091 [Coniophora puteana RWD-64-598 SS2]|uniref:Uncharacterized protein n=1 Tax=Coniophora puteana (strain RWD-64-598) TaxID=741705 RepID=A0A5M3MLL3_CONPW|nr:uncharacterized protein CONPUDRAFT_145091 [Coniophora puteana RWD-64-598 SS2]EIW80122.1 hypothetical protein CONPUDRAFT_145091 [Coniophora puteana RWD-64-598 SS2]
MALSLTLLGIALGVDAIPFSGALAAPIPRDDNHADDPDSGEVPTSHDDDTPHLKASERGNPGNYIYSGGDLFSPFYRAPDQANNLAAGSPSLSQAPSPAPMAQSQPSATAPASSPPTSEADTFAKEKAWVIGTVVGVLVALIIGLGIIKALSVRSKRERGSSSSGPRYRPFPSFQVLRSNRTKPKSNIAIVVSPPSYNTSTLLVSDGYIYGSDTEKSKMHEAYSDFEEINLLDDSRADTSTSASSSCQSPATPASGDIGLGIHSGSCSDVDADSSPTPLEDLSFIARSKKRASIKSIATIRSKKRASVIKSIESDTQLKPSTSSIYSVDGTLSDISSGHGPDGMVDQRQAREALLNALMTPAAAPVQHGRTKSEPAREKVSRLSASPSAEVNVDVPVTYNKSRFAKARSLGAAL